MSGANHNFILGQNSSKGGELPPQYNPQETESKIYKLWEESGFFNPDNLPTDRYQDAETYTVILPPPNANAPLHAGHALGRTIEDILVRFERMRGKKTLWLPGTDHAGFETQVVFEKKLEKEGRSRFHMEREEFYKEIWEFVAENRHVSEEGLKRLGASLDWSRNIFTLDPRIIKIVYETFEKMYADGLIYRGNRISNWCTKHQTTLSDLETKYEERIDPLYYIKYGPFELATVRPETKFGDTAVAVNPNDPRYQKYVGQEIKVETVLGPAKLKVIADEAVDIEFGTGVVKVTPAHDATDYEIWQRHKDEIPGPKQVIDNRGKLNELTGPYHGLKVKEAREKIVTDMRTKNLITKVSAGYKHNVQLCYKCGTVIEPLIVPQWYVAMTKPPPNGRPALRDMAIEAVKTKAVKIIPEGQEKVLMHWMENIRDWPISRQIWWGIRIPVWYCLGCGKIKVNAEIKSKWFIVRHGETDWNKENRMLGGDSDIPLNNLGRAQAEAIAQRLKDQNIELVISSDLLRASESAEIIARAAHVENITDPRLREKRHGEADGMNIDEAKEKFRELHGYESDAANGESYRAVEERTKAALLTHKEKHGHKNVVIVGHSGVIRTLRKHIQNLTPEQMFELPRMKNMEVFSMDILDPCPECGGDLYEQDPDTLDTWFSSGQWPYSTLMAHDKKDIETFYPTSTLVTAAEILFFWVARMIMFSHYRTGKEPFKTVLLHGLVRDKDKQKMSKSRGNVVDPLGIIDTYGTDALRFGLIFATATESDIALSEDRIRGMKHFANKLWNIARFVLVNASSVTYQVSHTEKLTPLTDADSLILNELGETIKNVTKNLEGFALHEAAQEIYDFIWHKFADKYIEASKTQLKDEAQKKNTEAILIYTLETSLKLLHPFMPFVTEEIYQKIHKGREILMVATWPTLNSD